MFSHGLHSSCSEMPPTEFTEYTEPSCCMFSHGLHRFTQMLLSGGALVSSAPTRSVVALLALLVHLRQVHPLERTYLCRSVKSVGEYLRGRVTSQSPARHARADRRCTARSGGCRTIRHGWQTAVRDVPTRARGGASGR